MKRKVFKRYPIRVYQDEKDFYDFLQNQTTGTESLKLLARLAYQEIGNQDLLEFLVKNKKLTLHFDSTASSTFDITKPKKGKSKPKKKKTTKTNSKVIDADLDYWSGNNDEF